MGDIQKLVGLVKHEPGYGMLLIEMRGCYKSLDFKGKADAI